MKKDLHSPSFELKGASPLQLKARIKYFLLLSLLASALLQVTAQTPDSWTQKSSLPATTRSAAFAFAIGPKGYVGGGLNFTMGGSLKDFWEYNPSTDSWTQKANFGGGARSGAVAFTIGDKGYVITGSGNASKKKDIWEYDTLLNSWTKKTDLPSTARNYSVAFSIGNKGYIGTGYTSNSFISLNDFWEYDPASDTWTQKADVPGPQRSSAIGFAIDGKGYIGTGDTCDIANCFSLNDFYSYDTLNNSWTQKADAGIDLRNSAAAFVINGKGYLCTGEVNSSNTNDLLEYNPALDSWTARASIPGDAKEGAVGFAIGNHGYVGTGFDQSFNTTADLYEYTPDTSKLATLVNEISNFASVTISPDPVIDEATFTVISNNDYSKLTLEVFTSEGKSIPSSMLQKEATGNEKLIFTFKRNDLPPGVYYFKVEEQGHILATGKFVVI